MLLFKRFTILISILLLVMNSSAEELPVIEVSFFKSSYLYFQNEITSVDIGYNDDYDALMKNNELKITAINEDINYETNLTVKTKNGIYGFLIIYKEKPKTLYHFINPKVAIRSFSKNDNRKNETDPFLDVLKKDNGEKEIDTIAQKLYNSTNKDYINGIVNDKMFFGLEGIYIKNEKLYLIIIIENNSNINYDINFLKFKIDDKKRAKKSAVQENYKNPDDVFGSENQIKSNESIKKVYVFNKFTLPDKKHLSIELQEKDGGRHLSFNVSKKDLLRAQKF